MATPSALDAHTQALVNHLFDLHAEAEEAGITLVTHGALALISSLYLPPCQQRNIALLFHDLAEIARFVPAPVQLAPRTDRRVSAAI